MTYWFTAICDKHKVYKSIFVTSIDEISLYCIDKKSVGEFLLKHIECDLRLTNEFKKEGDIPEGYKNLDIRE